MAEAERSLHDALCVLHSTVKVIYFFSANSERPLVIAGEEVGSFNWVISIGILVSSEEIFVHSTGFITVALNLAFVSLMRGKRRVALRYAINSDRYCRCFSSALLG